MLKNDPPDQTNLDVIKHYLSSVEVPSVDYGQNPIILRERINKTWLLTTKIYHRKNIYSDGSQNHLK